MKPEKIQSDTLYTLDELRLIAYNAWMDGADFGKYGSEYGSEDFGESDAVDYVEAFLTEEKVNSMLNWHKYHRT